MISRRAAQELGSTLPTGGLVVSHSDHCAWLLAMAGMRQPTVIASDPVNRVKLFSPHGNLRYTTGSAAKLVSLDNVEQDKL